VKLLGRVVRFLAWLVALGWAVWLIRKVFAGSESRRRVATRMQSPQPPMRLYRDPWCGTHVSPEISFPLEQEGRRVHFCSAECRAHYAQLEHGAAEA
jgi:YHS domain-containing protein